MIARDPSGSLCEEIKVFMTPPGHGAKARLAPTTLFLDEAGVIQWLHRPRRVADRLTPDAILQRLDRGS